MWRSTQREILRKRPKKHLRILGDCWEKFICSSLPVRLMGEFPASKKHLRPATWLTGKFPSRRMSRYYSPVWVWGDRVKFSLSVRGEGGGGAVADKYHIPATLDNKSPQTACIDHLTAIIFLPRQYHFIKSPSQQKFDYRTDILRKRSTGYPCM